MTDIIWTKHAIARASERKIPQGQIIKTISDPDHVRINKDHTREFEKKFNHQKANAVVKENDLGEKIILSVWVDPPNYGTAEFRRHSMNKKFRKASMLKKFWLTVLNQAGF